MSGFEIHLDTRTHTYTHTHAHTLTHTHGTDAAYFTEAIGMQWQHNRCSLSAFLFPPLLSPAPEAVEFIQD